MHPRYPSPEAFTDHIDPDPMRNIDTAIVLHGVLAAIPERQRLLLECAYVYGMPHAEIGDRLPDMPSQSAVKQRLHRARGALLRRLAAAGIQRYDDIR